jgi:hypothetical protein
MPNRDGTGPLWGRAVGYHVSTGNGICGLGRGCGRRLGLRCLQYNSSVSTDKSPQETEQVLLERERKMLKERLDFIQNKLEKL